MTKSKLWAIFPAFLFWGVYEGLRLGLQFAVPLLPALPKWAIGAGVGGILCLVMIGVTRLFLRKDSLTLSDLGMTFSPGSLRRFLVSFAIGGVLFGGILLAYLLLTPVQLYVVENPNFLHAVFISFFVFLCLGSMEEVVFRGYFLKKLESAVGIRFAIYLTSIAFGLYHGLTLDSLTGPAFWGLWYGALAYWTKGLAIPIGFHAGLNYTQALLSQKEKWVSGVWYMDLTDEVTLLTIEQLSTILQVLVLVIGIVMVEATIARIKKAGTT